MKEISAAPTPIHATSQAQLWSIKVDYIDRFVGGLCDTKSLVDHKIDVFGIKEFEKQFSQPRLGWADAMASDPDDRPVAGD